MNYLLLILTFIITLGARSQYSGLPITLSIPYDQDTIEETEPTFVWQANLEAIQSDPRLTQQIVVAEIGEDQTPSEALSLNVPVFIRQELQTNSIAYSSTDYEMLKNVWYAWQVSYLFNGTVVQQSEVWKFINADPLKPVKQYIGLRRQPDAAVYTLTEPYLYLKISEQGTLDMKATVRTPSGEKKTVTMLPEGSASSPATVVSNGALNCTVDLTPLHLEKGDYTFYWLTPEGRKCQLRFCLKD